MNPLLIFSIIGGGILLLGGSASAFASSGDSGDGGVSRENPYRLPDIDSSLQKGHFTQTFDASIEKASNETGVPFALIKAHMLRESSGNPGAYRYESPTKGASYGLLQVLWVQGSDRFAQWGYPDSQLGFDGSFLYDPDLNCLLGAYIIQDNLNRFGGSRLRDAVNAFNTGVAESVRRAPNNYVDDVLKYYSTIVGVSVA